MLINKYVSRYYLRYSYLFILGIIALIAVDYYQLKIPEIYGSIIDGLNGKVAFTKEILLNYIKEMFIVMAVMVLGRFMWRVCLFGASTSIESDLRKRMFDHNKDLGQDFFQTHKTGALMALYTNDLSTVRECFGPGTVMLIDIAFLGALALVKMYHINPMLTFLSIIPLAIIAVCGNIIGKYMRNKWKNRQEAYEDMSDYVQESFSGISVIKAFVKEGKELLAFSRINKNNLDANMTFVKSSTLLHVLINLFVQFVVVIILGYGGYLVYKNPDVFTVGTLTEFIGYFSAVTWPMMAVARLINLRSQGKASLKRISDLLDEVPSITDKKDCLKLNNIEGKIEFRNLNFKYPNTETNVLNNISFVINPGEKVGIIGPTGSGKTTIIQLLLRLYNIEDGEVLIDDVNIMDLKIKQVRDIISYVPQDNFLFSDKIKANIAFAYNDSNIDDVAHYAELADVDENIKEFKNQYDTVLGERGVTVSGGQKQRISIARALMKESQILILDDSVSAVDTKTEEKILNNLNEIRKDKTTIIIAHRISTIKDCDKIILIDDGKVTGIGTHNELLKSSKEYSHMVSMQHLEDEIGGDE